MGNAFYEVWRNGEKIDAGYDVLDICNTTEEPCDRKIDRGLDHLCGLNPGGDEYGCGAYCCAVHLYTINGDEEYPGYLCGPCASAREKKIRASLE